MRCLVSPEPFAARPPRALFGAAFPEAALPEAALTGATLPRAVRLPLALRPLLDCVEDDVAFLIGSRSRARASRSGQDARSAATDRASQRQVMRACTIIS